MLCTGARVQKKRVGQDQTIRFDTIRAASPGRKTPWRRPTYKKMRPSPIRSGNSLNLVTSQRTPTPKLCGPGGSRARLKGGRNDKCKRRPFDGRERASPEFSSCAGRRAYIGRRSVLGGIFREPSPDPRAAARSWTDRLAEPLWSFCGGSISRGS